MASALLEPDTFELARRIEIGLFADWLQQANSGVVEQHLDFASRVLAATKPSVAELVELVNEGQKAVESLFNANLGLVWVIVKRLSGGQLDTQELFQEGCLGLLEAICHFDYKRGVKFASYAGYWIKSAVFRQCSMLKYSTVYREKLRHKVVSGKEKLDIVLGRSASVEELSAYLNLTKYLVSQGLVSWVRSNVSLDQLVDGDKTAEGELFNNYWVSNSELVASLAYLTERQRQVITNLYGIGIPSKTVQELAVSLKISASTVRRLEKLALVKMRQVLNLGYSPGSGNPHPVISGQLAA